MKTYVDFLRFVTSESHNDSFPLASLQNGGVWGSISWGGGEAKAVLWPGGEIYGGTRFSRSICDFVSDQSIQHVSFS
jgi:hypothetical protein